MYKHIIYCLVVLFVAGCGHSGGSDTTTVNPSADPKTVSFVFSVISTSKLPSNVGALKFKVHISDNYNIVSDALTGEISQASLVSAPNAPIGNMVFGIYSASTRTAYISAVNSDPAFRHGDVVQLTCTEKLSDWTANGFPIAGFDPTLMQASGMDSSYMNSFDLTNKLLVQTRLIQ